MSVLYGIIAGLSVICSLLCLFLIKKKHFLFVLFFTLVCITNVGCFIVSITDNLHIALVGNTISYFGNVFLPPIMLATVLSICNIKIPKWVDICAFFLAVVMFGLASTQLTELNLFYKEVVLEEHYGCTILNKEYGPLHVAHTIYITLYVLVTISVSIYTIIKGTIKKYYTHRHAIFLTLILGFNYLVWLVQKLVPGFVFDLLPITYFLSIVFLITLNWIIQDYALLHEYGAKENLREGKINIKYAKVEEKVEYLLTHRCDNKLTTREKEILTKILENKKRKQIADELVVSENTVKTHIKNLFDKLNVNSREELENLFN